MSDKVWFIDEGQAMSEEIIVGKVTYLGPTAVDPRDAEIERLRRVNAADLEKLTEAVALGNKQAAEFDRQVFDLRAEIAALKATLKDAKECIRIWHNMDCHGMDQEQIDGLWQSYDQNSPEMNRINAMLEGKS